MSEIGMKFEVSKDVVQDMIALYGKDHAINELVAGYRAALETAVDEIEQENIN